MQTDGGQTFSGQTTSKQAISGQTSNEQNDQGQTISGQTTTGQNSERQTTSGQTGGVQTFSSQYSDGQTTSGQYDGGQISSAQNDVGQTPSGQNYNGQTTEGQNTENAAGQNIGGQKTGLNTDQQKAVAQNILEQISFPTNAEGLNTDAHNFGVQNAAQQNANGQNAEGQNVGGQTSVRLTRNLNQPTGSVNQVVNLLLGSTVPSISAQPRQKQSQGSNIDLKTESETSGSFSRVESSSQMSSFLENQQSINTSPNTITDHKIDSTVVTNQKAMSPPDQSATGLPPLSNLPTAGPHQSTNINFDLNWTTSKTQSRTSKDLSASFEHQAYKSIQAVPEELPMTTLSSAVSPVEIQAFPIHTTTHSFPKERTIPVSPVINILVPNNFAPASVNLEPQELNSNLQIQDQRSSNEYNQPYPEVYASSSGSSVFDHSTNSVTGLPISAHTVQSSPLWETTSFSDVRSEVLNHNRETTLEVFSIPVSAKPVNPLSKTSSNPVDLYLETSTAINSVSAHLPSGPGDFFSTMISQTMGHSTIGITDQRSGAAQVDPNVSSSSSPLFSAQSSQDSISESTKTSTSGSQTNDESLSITNIFQVTTFCHILIFKHGTFGGPGLQNFSRCNLEQFDIFHYDHCYKRYTNLKLQC